jgi:hypothetical protein
MRVSQIRLAAVGLMSGLLLGGCAYDTYGDPYGYGYGYGPRSSVSIGVGYGGGYGGYYGGYGYGSYGYPYGGYYGGYGYDPFGWYGDYYYPGTGVYVYDRSRTRRAWSGDQQRYWMQRRQQWQNHSGAATSSGENWSGWDRSRWRGNGGTSTSVNGAQSTRGGRGHHHGDRDD